MKNGSFLWYVLVTAAWLLLTIAIACAPGTSPRPSAAPPATLAPAAVAPPTPRSGGKVTVYSALSEATNSAIVAAFERAQPVIGVEVLSLAAAADLQRHLRLEGSAPRADVFLGGSSEFHEPLGRAGLLEAYRSPRAFSVPPELKDPNGYWTGWYLGVLGLILNTDLWDRELSGKPEPTTWDDLLDPALEGRLAMPDPTRTGAGYIFLASQVFRFGRNEARALDYMRRLHRGVGQYTETSPGTIELVGQGRFAVGINWGHDVLSAAAGGRPVRFVAPENTAFEVGAVSIVRGGPNTIGARSFTDWVLSPESAQVIVRLSNRLSVLKQVEPVPGAPRLDSVKLVGYDRTWATENEERLLAKWQAAVGR